MEVVDGRRRWKLTSVGVGEPKESVMKKSQARPGPGVSIKTDPLATTVNYGG